MNRSFLPIKESLCFVYNNPTLEAIPSVLVREKYIGCVRKIQECCEYTLGIFWGTLVLCNTTNCSRRVSHWGNTIL